MSVPRDFYLASIGVASVLLLLGACSRPPAPAERDAAPDRPAPPAAPVVVRDAAAEVGDAVPEASGPTRPHHARHRPSTDGARGASGGFKIDGNLAKADAEKTLAAGKAKLRGCYEQEHAKNPALHGKVSFRLTVDDRGRVSLGEVVTSSLGGGDPEMCMIEALRDLKFAPPAGGGESKLSFQMAFGR
ncbi:MAG TPA: AgmX/PglI C-terminal domain-containing protein [Polyangia bacterium]|nr:AgmX/PglI C-terminal domain-containing protein [Polyangia bacterium]